jgi:hypothetical protein
VSVADLLDGVPDGWSVAVYAGRRYGVTKTPHAGGRSVSVYAEELGGPDVISANLYLTGAGEAFRPCEMPAEKVLAFLRGAMYTHDDPGASAPGS